MPLSEDLPIGEIGKNTVDPQLQYKLSPTTGLLKAKDGVYIRQELKLASHGR